METITAWIVGHWMALLAFLSAAVLVPTAKKLLTLMTTKGFEWVETSLEHLRTEINNNEVAAQLQADDAIITILESYLPEVIHELDSTLQTEIKNGKFSSLDWNALGASLWAKGRAEIEVGYTNYMETSGEKDGKIIAALVSRKFFTKQAALKKDLIVPHE